MLLLARHYASAVPKRPQGLGDATAERAHAGRNADGDARALPPIRTLTVGPGISPEVNRPLAAVGSRTVTAGSDFHRPRSARALVTTVLHVTSGYRRPDAATTVTKGTPRV